MEREPIRAIRWNAGGFSISLGGLPIIVCPPRGIIRGLFSHHLLVCTAPPPPGKNRKSIGYYRILYIQLYPKLSLYPRLWVNPKIPLEAILELLVSYRTIRVKKIYGYPTYNSVTAGIPFGHLISPVRILVQQQGIFFADFDIPMTHSSPVRSFEGSRWAGMRPGGSKVGKKLPGSLD